MLVIGYIAKIYKKNQKNKFLGIFFYTLLYLYMNELHSSNNNYNDITKK